MQLDEDKLEALRRWGQRLRDAGNEETAAAGRAILMLIEEVERLRLDQLHAREQLSQLVRLPSAEADHEAGEPVASTLHGRVQRILRRSDSPSEPRPPSVEDAKSDPETDEPRKSAQAWIQSLRRQE